MVVPGNTRGHAMVTAHGGRYMSMTVKEMAALIGTTGLYNVSRDVYMSVKILDMRLSYGNVQAQITPVAGEGEMWVQLGSIKAQS
jgi:hypothetical protein